MLSFLFRILLTFNATSLLVIIFLIKEEMVLWKIFPSLCPHISSWPDEISYFAYIIAPVLLTGLSIGLSRFLSEDDFKPVLIPGTEMKESAITSIEYANNSFLPSYLGYFFVALSINSFDTLYFVYGILFVFTFMSQALYFNPLFLLYNFKFYNITTKNGSVIFLISRDCYKIPKNVEIEKVYRINDFTYIERG